MNRLRTALPRVTVRQPSIEVNASGPGRGTRQDAGSDTTWITTTARRDGDSYVVDGQKNWTSRIAQSDLLLLLAWTAPRDAQVDRTGGLSLFLIDLREVCDRQPHALQITPVRILFTFATYQVHYAGLRVPASSLVGPRARASATSTTG
jgi:acyl-CoA dehydrogenase